MKSTPSKNTAQELSLKYEIFGHLPSHGQSLSNRLGDIAFGDEHMEIHERRGTQGYVQKILDVFAGLESPLFMAGLTAGTKIDESVCIHNRFEVHGSKVEVYQRLDETKTVFSCTASRAVRWSF